MKVTKILALASIAVSITCTAASAALSPQAVALCEKGSPKEIKAAIKKGSLRVNDTNDQGMTPLMIAAASNKNTEVTRVLIKAGAKVDYSNPQSLLALTSPNAGGNLPEPMTGMTPLMYAAIKGRADTVEVLLKAKAPVNARDAVTGHSAFIRAAMFNRDARVLRLLLKSGASKYYRSKTFLDMDALMIAAMLNPSPEIIKFLVQEAGFWVSDNNMVRQSPLALAASYNPSPEIVGALIDLGADPNEAYSISNLPEGLTPLMLAANSNPNPAVVRELLRKGADGKAIDKTGHTAASYAKGNKYMVGTKEYADLYNLHIEVAAELDAARFQNSEPVNALTGALTGILGMPFKILGGK